MLERLTLAQFADLVGSKFRIHRAAAESIEVELSEATALRSRPRKDGASAGREPFSLVFRGPKHVLLPQQTYAVEHDRLGRFDLFLVPIGPDDVGLQYEAVFN